MMELSKYNQQESFNPGFWEHFYDDFQAHANGICELNEWTQSTMIILHLQLLLNKSYQKALKSANNKVIDKKYLITSIFNSHFLNVKLITITPEHSLPLHDHPGTSGSMMVISGQVHAVVCEQDSLQNNRQACSMLKIVANTTLSHCDSCCFTQSQHNIHRLKALTESAVILIAHVNPFAINKQSYFFSNSLPQKLHSHIKVQRVRNRAFQNLRHNQKET